MATPKQLKAAQTKLGKAIKQAHTSAEKAQRAADYAMQHADSAMACFDELVKLQQGDNDQSDLPSAVPVQTAFANVEEED